MTSVKEWFMSLFALAPLVRATDLDAKRELDAARRRFAAATRLHAGVARRTGIIGEQTAAREAIPEDVVRARDGMRETVEELIRRTR